MVRHILFLAVVISMSPTAFSQDIFQIMKTRNVHALSLITNDVQLINSVNKSGDTPLMIAARIGDVSMVKMLVDASANVGVRNHGFTVKEQVEGYLRRTGDSRKTIEQVLEDLGVNRQTIESFQRESDSLEASPSRIQAWRTILGMLRDKEAHSSEWIEASEGKLNQTPGNNCMIDKGKLSMIDLKRIFSTFVAESNAVCLVAKDESAQYLAVFDMKKARNMQGGESVRVPVGGAIKLASKDLLISLSGLEVNKNEESVLWRFNVDLEFVRRGDEGDEIVSRQGVVSARKDGSSEIIVEVE